MQSATGFIKLIRQLEAQVKEQAEQINAINAQMEELRTKLNGKEKRPYKRRTDSDS